MANLFLSPNSYSPTLIQNRNLSSIKIKINRRHYPFRTLQHHYIRLVCALKEDSNPETVQGTLLYLSAKLIHLSDNLIFTVKFFIRWRGEKFRSQSCAVHVEIL